MHISKLIQDTMTGDLLGHLAGIDAFETGTLLTAMDLSSLLSFTETTEADPLHVLKMLVDPIAQLDPDREIMAVRVADGGLLTYGWKLMVGADGPALFGDRLPEGLSIEIKKESIGKKGAEFDRPYARITLEWKDAKGKKKTTELDTGLASTEKALEISYQEWCLRCAGLDEDELASQGLIASWATPKLGSGGNRSGLYKLAEQGSAVFRVLNAVYSDHAEKVDRNGSPIPLIAFTLVDPNGSEPFELFPEVAYDFLKGADKGGYGWGYAMDVAIIKKIPVYMRLKGLKDQKRWDKDAKAEVVQYKPDGSGPYRTFDLSFAVGAATPVTKTAIASSVPAGVLALKSAAAEDAEYDDAF